MSETIGKRLGGFLAHYEQMMLEQGGDETSLAKMHQLSEIYRNLADADLGDFRRDFSAGYKVARSNIEEDLDSEPRGLGLDFPDPSIA